jgi:hypothetical protein
MANPLSFKRLYLPLASGDSLVVAENIGRDSVTLTIDHATEGAMSVILTLEEWRALSNLYYDLAVWAPQTGATP